MVSLTGGSCAERSAQCSSADLAPTRPIVCSRTASDYYIVGVNDGSTPLLGIVKALGQYLTATEDDIRLQGKFSSCSSIGLVSALRRALFQA